MWLIGVQTEKLVKLFTRDLGRINRQLESLLVSCPSEECNSCAVVILKESIEKMNGYKLSFENIEDDEAKKEYVRSDMIKYINDVNNERRDIPIKKATDETAFTECDRQSLEIYKMTKSVLLKFDF